MVKIYAISIFYKSPNDAKLLKCHYDLQSFSFFQRGEFDVEKQESWNFPIHQQKNIFFSQLQFLFSHTGSVQEFCQFASKTIVERTTQSTRQSVKQDVYMCHVYVRSDNLSGVLIADHEYPGSSSRQTLRVDQSSSHLISD